LPGMSTAGRTVVINLAKPAEQGGDPSSLFKARDVITAVAGAFHRRRL
jgi:rRNA processing protein Krr1/Pno1